MKRLLVVLTFLLGAISTGFAATVTNTNDSGPGSLRDAIAATPAGGTVNFALSGCPCTIVLTTGDLEINRDLTVIGPGADQLTISGNNAWRIFQITGPSGPTPTLVVVLEGMKIANGSAGQVRLYPGLQGYGGGILSVNAILTVRNSVVSNNETNLGHLNGGGIAAVISNTLIINSTISGNSAGFPSGSGFPHGHGGGIYNIEGNLVVERSSISNNQTSGLGGGIASTFYYTTQIRNSSISGNTAFRASGVFVSAFVTAEIVNTTIEGNTSINDAAINNQIATINIVNSTISGNIAGPGSGGLTGSGCAGIVNLNFNPGYPDEPINSTVTITNTTITGNQGVVTEIASVGGIYTEAVPNEPNYPATTIVRNSIVAGNTPGPEIAKTSNAEYQSSGYNLIGNAGSITVFNQPGDQAGTPGAPIDPRLEALAFNGGPTKTHALKLDSPALDRGFRFGYPTDQRGVSRPVDEPNIPNAPGGDGSDIGGFEGGQPGSNPIDFPEVFVRQHYHDFLNREPDAEGLAFWSNEIISCGGDPACTDHKRVNVSAAYFLSIEFQETGYLVYRTYKASYGNLPNAPVPIKLDEFLPDTQQIGQGVIVNQNGWEQLLENNKQNFFFEFVQRSRFASLYPTSLTPGQFVNQLFTNTSVTPSTIDRETAINEFGGMPNTADIAARARALRRVAENQTLAQQEFNRAFVLMQYFGYLRRNPNDPPEAALNFAGYNFWLNKLNQFNGDYVQAEMVRAFLLSTEYRRRFGP